MATLKTVNQRLAKAELLIMGVLLLIMSVLAFTQVITRYLVHASMGWIEEMLRYMMICLGYFGVSRVSYESSHIEIDLLSSLIHRIIPFDFKIILDFISTAFMCLLLYYACIFISQTISYGQVSATMRIPMAAVYCVFPIGFGLGIFHIIANYLIKIAERKEKAKCN